MAKAVFTTKVTPVRKGRGKPRAAPDDRPPLLEFLGSFDLKGLDLTRERDTGRD